MASTYQPRSQESLFPFPVSLVPADWEKRDPRNEVVHLQQIFAVLQLQINPDERITAPEALRHDWIAQGDFVPALNRRTTLVRLTAFNARRKLKGVVLGLIARKRYALILFNYTVPIEISCFHDHGQGVVLSLLYYLEIIRQNRQK